MCFQFLQLQDIGDAFPSTPEARRQIIGDPASHVALLPFSSGTTGLPKSVQLSHFNLVANLTQISTHEELLGPTADGSRDRALGENREERWSRTGRFDCRLEYRRRVCDFRLYLLLRHGKWLIEEVQRRKRRQSERVSKK